MATRKQLAMVAAGMIIGSISIYPAIADDVRVASIPNVSTTQDSLLDRAIEVIKQNRESQKKEPTSTEAAPTSVPSAPRHHVDLDHVKILGNSIPM